MSTEGYTVNKSMRGFMAVYTIFTMNAIIAYELVNKTVPDYHALDWAFGVMTMVLAGLGLGKAADVLSAMRGL